jgi:holo-[acyl-carrier protein] synthase
MIAGIGIDIIEVERIAEKMGKERGFRELVFSPQEIVYCEPMTHKYEHYAARFAAKEAFFKALGTGWASGTELNEIQITNDRQGRPVLSLLGKTASTLNGLGIDKMHVSLSHLRAMACAVVIIEKKDP